MRAELSLTTSASQWTELRGGSKSTEQNPGVLYLADRRSNRRAPLTVLRSSGRWSRPLKGRSMFTSCARHLCRSVRSVRVSLRQVLDLKMLCGEARRPRLPGHFAIRRSAPYKDLRFTSCCFLGSLRFYSKIKNRNLPLQHKLAVVSLKGFGLKHDGQPTSARFARGVRSAWHRFLCNINCVSLVVLTPARNPDRGKRRRALPFAEMPYNAQN